MEALGVEDLGFIFEFVDEVVDVRYGDARRPGRRRADFGDDVGVGIEVDTEVLGVVGVEGLLLGPMRL